MRRSVQLSYAIGTRRRNEYGEAESYLLAYFLSLLIVWLSRAEEYWSIEGMS